MIPGHWQAVTRSDGETVGYVEAADDQLVARDLLGIELGRAGSHDEAAALVVERGLASLGRSWSWTDGTGETRRVHLLHVRPGTRDRQHGAPQRHRRPGRADRGGAADRPGDVPTRVMRCRIR